MNEIYFPIIQIKNVSYKYSKDKITLNDISFNVHKGSFHGLIGTNGDGKSTLLKLLVKSLNLQSGKILINNKSIF